MTISQVLGAVGVARTLRPKTGRALDLDLLLIVWGLALAIACFAIALVPPRLVPWRPAAAFVANRHVDLTLVGVGLLMAAAVAFFSTRGV